MNTKTTVSFVIPVYNEADRIADCLRAIAAQTVQPLEVIVVDNNSDDGTAAIASRYPFVTVLSEAQQGVVYARDTGFSAAKGDIIARIDADTIIADNWVQTLSNIFENTDIDLVTGSVTLREISAPRLASRVDLFWRRYLHRRLGTRVGLQGANMALRRTVWQQIKRETCRVRGIHEDFDIGIHAGRHGFKARFSEELQASICHRQLNGGFIPFADYALTSPRTYLGHGVREGRVMYRVVAFGLLLYPVISIMSRGYDPIRNKFSISYLLSPVGTPRVNPATFVD